MKVGESNAPHAQDGSPADRGGRNQKASDPWQNGHALAVEAAGFVSGRLGPSGIEPADEERAGLGFDLSAWLTLSREYVLGFGLARADLGSVSAGEGTNEFDADYAVTSAYLGARAFPWRSEDFELFVGLRVGLAWQDLDARGIRSFQPNVLAPDVFACSGVAGPGLGLGAGIGAAFRIAPRAWFVGRLDASGYRLTSETVDACAVGIGSVTTASLGAGLLYAFDLGAENALGGAALPRAQTW